jgi:hypothetical protein
MDKVEVKTDEKMAKDIKLLYVELQVHNILYQSGLSADE